MSASKARGTRWETASTRYLAKYWPAIERRSLGGMFDKGDKINGPVEFTIEDKDTAKVDIPKQLREAEAERLNAGTRFSVLLRKQRRGPKEPGRVEDGWAVMRIKQWAVLVIEHERMALMLRAQGVPDHFWKVPGDNEEIL